MPGDESHQLMEESSRGTFSQNATHITITVDESHYDIRFSRMLQPFRDRSWSDNGMRSTDLRF